MPEAAQPGISFAAKGNSEQKLRGSQLGNARGDTQMPDNRTKRRDAGIRTAT